MNKYQRPNNKQQNGMAMIIVLTVAFVVLVTVGIGAAIVASNLNMSDSQTNKNKADLNVTVGLERLKGMYKKDNEFFASCSEDDCINTVDGHCISCSDPKATYDVNGVKYKIEINSLTPPGDLTVGSATLLVTGYYKNVIRKKTVNLCLNYCASSNPVHDCGDNGCGGICGQCVEPATCGGGGEQGICGGAEENCDDISEECADSCVAGSICGGGVVIDADSNIVVSPAGCNGSSCDGELDSVTGAWDETETETTGASDVENGEVNMDFLNDPSYWAAQFCADSQYYSFDDDWYLPAINELSSIYYAIGQGWTSGYVDSATYWSSTEDSDNSIDQAQATILTTGEGMAMPKSEKFYVRCLRRY